MFRFRFDLDMPYKTYIYLGTIIIEDCLASKIIVHTYNHKPKSTLSYIMHVQMCRMHMQYVCVVINTCKSVYIPVKTPLPQQCFQHYTAPSTTQYWQHKVSGPTLHHWTADTGFSRTQTSATYEKRRDPA